MLSASHASSCYIPKTNSEKGYESEKAPFLGKPRFLHMCAPDDMTADYNLPHLLICIEPVIIFRPGGWGQQCGMCGNSFPASQVSVK